MEHRQYSRPPSTPSGGVKDDLSQSISRPQLFNSQGLGVTPFNLSNKNFAKLVGPALIQYRILQKKKQWNTWRRSIYSSRSKHLDN
jgi:hypothetical protein